MAVGAAPVSRRSRDTRQPRPRRGAWLTIVGVIEEERPHRPPRAPRLRHGPACAAVLAAGVGLAVGGAVQEATTPTRGTAAPPPAAAPLRLWPAPEVDAPDAVRKAYRDGMEAVRRAEAQRLSEDGGVAALLRRAMTLRQVDPAEHGRHARTWQRAWKAVDDLEGRRRAELRTVLRGVERLAAGRRLSASRLAPTMLTVRENTRLWRTARLPRPGDRRRVAGGAVIVQYYPGQGWQPQPLASWGQANALARRCLSASQQRRDEGRSATCPGQRRALGHRLETLLGLAVRRGGALAWEYGFSYAGGSPPWVSGMAQATAAQALARAGVALDDDGLRAAARDALGTLEQDPPLGVAVRAPGGGRRYALYSFQPTLRVLNAELQAVLALRDVTKLLGSTTARRLYLRGDRALRATLASYDTGAWSLYSAGGREATAGYHRLQRQLLGRLCQRTDRGAYCALHERFARYEREVPDIDLRVPERGRTGRAIAVRFTLSKVSEVAIRVEDAGGRTVTTRVIDKPRGTYSVPFTPSRAGRHQVRVEARGPIGPAEVSAERVRVRDAP